MRFYQKLNIIGVLVFFAISPCAKFNAQTAKDYLIKDLDSIFEVKNLKNIDQTYDVLKERALSLELDSLYITLTFQQIEKNGGLLLYTNSEVLLENLLINENYFLKKIQNCY
jgi:hypothetical protein